jgi:hypothetical protein
MVARRALEALLNGSGPGENGTANGAAHAAGAAAPSADLDVWHELRREIARARRFGRSFALVRIGRIAGTALSSSLRTIDRLWVANGRTYVLLPEASREAGEGFVARVRRDVPDALAESAVSVAAFPEDGVTTGALLKALGTGNYGAARERAREEQIADQR